MGGFFVSRALFVWVVVFDCRIFLSLFGCFCVFVLFGRLFFECFHCLYFVWLLACSFVCFSCFYFFEGYFIIYLFVCQILAVFVFFFLSRYLFVCLYSSNFIVAVFQSSWSLCLSFSLSFFVTR